jgi:heme-degrading monooxygenase HmoA
MNSPPITVIVAFEVPAESVEQFISDWRTDKDFMIRQPGCIGGSLYRSLQSDARFRFVNIARWESEEDWKAALEAGEKHRTGKGIYRLSDWNKLGIKVNPAAYREEIRY